MVRRIRIALTALAFLSLVPLAPAVAGGGQSFQGVVRLWHGDTFTAAPTKQGAVLDLGKGVQYALDMPLSKAAAYAGATVRVTGLLRAGTLTPTSAVDVVALDPNLAGAATTNGTVTAAATTKQVVVIAFTFPDLTTQPKTLAQIEDLVWDADSSNPSSIRAYYEESSDAAFSITGGVLGYYQITATSAGNCNYSTWSSQARTLAATDATNAGYDLNTATIVYVFPTVGTCGWAGLGQLPGTTSWINGYVDLRVIGHELGHNFGVHHAASVVCRDATGARIAYTARESDDCSYSEYGDPFSIMGGSSNLTHHAWQRQQLGYPVVSTTITPTAGFDQTYNLTALEPAADLNAVRLLRITRPGSSYLDVELRAPKSPFENFSVSSTAVTGITVRVGYANTNRSQSRLLDATFGTSSVSDAQVQPGQSIFDPVSGVTVTLVSVTSGVASVRVQSVGTDATAPSAVSNLQKSTDATPKVVLSWGAATDNRALAGYEIRRGGVKCAVAKALTITDTGTWTGCTGLTPGSTYTYAVVPYDASGNLGTATSIVVTVASTDVTAPSTPGTPAVTGVTASSVSLSWTPATDDVAMGGYEVFRNGTSLGTTTGTTYTDAGLTAATTYAYTVRAFDSSSNYSTLSGSVDGTTSAAPTYTATPTLTFLGAGQIRVDWTAGTAVVTYEVQREVWDARRKIWTSATTVATGLTSLTYTNKVTKAGTYRYSVRARSGTYLTAWMPSAQIVIASSQLK